MSAEKTVAADITAQMRRVGAGAGRVSVEMTHAQYSAIATAMCIASFDPYLSADVKAEFVKLRELLINAPLVGLMDEPVQTCDVHSTEFDNPICTVCKTDTSED